MRSSDYEDRAKEYRKERDEIFRVLIKLIVTRRKESTRAEAEVAYNEATAIIRKYEKRVKEDGITEKRADEITLVDLVHELKMTEAEQISVSGDDNDGELDWYVVAATGITAAVLQRWAMFDVHANSQSKQCASMAYAAYGEYTDNKNFRGDPMPVWEDLPEKIQEAWQAATIEIVRLADSQ
ncbi:hypothetical protein LCGC14_2887320, partial [marine sediment metagenome]